MTEWMLLYILTTAGAAPRVITVRHYGDETLCAIARDQLTAREREARKAHPRVASDLDVMCVEFTPSKSGGRAP